MALRNSLSVNTFSSDLVFIMFLAKYLCLTNKKPVKKHLIIHIKYRDNSVSRLKMVTVNSQWSDLYFLRMIIFYARINQLKVNHHPVLEAFFYLTQEMIYRKASWSQEICTGTFSITVKSLFSSFQPFALSHYITRAIPLHAMLIFTCSVFHL